MSDDEVTREADPNWLARLRDRSASNGDLHDEGGDNASNTAGNTAGDTSGDTEEDAADGPVDDEHTVGQGDLLDQVRAAVRDARADGSPRSLPAGLPSDLSSTTSAPVARSTPTALSFPPPDPASPVHSVKAAPTVTNPQARWQPPPRLKPVTPAAAPALITAPAGPNRSRRVLAAVVVAAIVALVVGVLIGRNSSSDPKPGDETEVTTDSSTTGTPTNDTTAATAPTDAGTEVGS